MSSKDTETGRATVRSAESSGQLLAAARESRSLSPADLAVRLRLDTKMVKALERDDFDNLPAPTFVKGYIRSIAKELGIDSAPILDAYTAHASVDPPTLADFSSRPPDQVGVNSTIIKAITYGLCALLVVLIILWWRTAKQAQQTTPVAMDEKEITKLVGADPLPYQYQIVQHDNSGWQTSPRTGTAGKLKDPKAAGEEEDPGSPGSAAEDDPAGAPLSITTTSEAWIEIYDSKDKRLYFDLATAAKPVKLKEHPYYRLRIGNSGSVTVRYRGKDVDLSAFTTDGIAKLELGKAAKIEDDT